MSDTLEEELDRLSLTQALVDADMATARVIDLTERLVDAASRSPACGASWSRYGLNSVSTER